MTSRMLGVLAMVFVGIVFHAPLSAETNTGLTELVGNTSPALQYAMYVGHRDPNEVMDIVVGLKVRNEQQLDDLIARQQDPSSADYHDWIIPDEFVSRFAPAQADQESVTDFLRSQGLSVLQVAPNRILIEARGTVAQVEQAFAVRINTYKLRGQQHFSNDRDPSVPSALSGVVQSISGLSSIDRAHSMAKIQPLGATVLATYTPFQIATAYNFPSKNNANHGITTYDGTGITIAIATAYNYNTSHVNFFWSYFKLTRTGSVTIVPVSGGSTTVNFETTIDVEQAGAQARGANLLLYETPDSSFGEFQLMYNQIVTDNKAQIMSTSWVACEAAAGSAQIISYEAIFKQGVSQGITFFVGSGDNGAYGDYCTTSPPTLAVDYPSTSQYFTAVGGTQVLLGSTNHIKSETAWAGSGGGVSSDITHPTWQTGAGVPKSSSRLISDVAFNASDATEYYVYWQGAWAGAYGTSFGGPNWAALWSLGLQALKGKRVGNAAPSVYKILGTGGATYTTNFRDITSGNNGYYSATKDWDYPTGVGTPKGSQLVNWMKSHL
jgi:subtilase family serine protease